MIILKITVVVVVKSPLAEFKLVASVVDPLQEQGIRHNFTQFVPLTQFVPFTQFVL